MFCLFHPFKLTPIISDPEYLLDQHILICVKSTDSDESYGNKRPCILFMHLDLLEQYLQSAGVLFPQERVA